HRLLDSFEARLPKPWIQMGHSMGGCLSLLALAKGEKRFAASALSAPMLGVIASGYMLYLARALVFLSRTFRLSGRYLFEDAGNPFELTFEKDRIAHDRARWDRYQAQLKAEPRLAIGNLTWGWLDFALKATLFLQTSEAVRDIHIPVLIVAAGDDDRVITADTARVAAKLPDRTYLEIPDAWHEILMETDDIRAVWWDAFDTLVARVCEPASKRIE
ncbi:MAG: alpha/beta hydrolase, partial [Caulobacteraceae bacterium]